MCVSTLRSSFCAQVTQYISAWEIQFSPDTYCGCRLMGIPAVIRMIVSIELAGQAISYASRFELREVNETLESVGSASWSKCTLCGSLLA